MIEDFDDLKDWFLENKQGNADEEEIELQSVDDLEFKAPSPQFDTTELKDIYSMTGIEGGINAGDMFWAEFENGEKKIIANYSDSVEVSGVLDYTDCSNEILALEYIRQNPAISDFIQAPKTTIDTNNNIMIQEAIGDKDLAEYGIIGDDRTSFDMTYEKAVEIEAVDWLVFNTDLHTENLRLTVRSDTVLVNFIDMDFAYNHTVVPENYPSDAHARRFGTSGRSLNLIYEILGDDIPEEPPSLYLQDVFEKMLEIFNAMKPRNTDIGIYGDNKSSIERAINENGQLYYDMMKDEVKLRREFAQDADFKENVAYHSAIVGDPNSQSQQKRLDISVDLEEMKEMFNVKRVDDDEFDIYEYYSNMDNLYELFSAVARQPMEIEADYRKTERHGLEWIYGGVNTEVIVITFRDHGMLDGEQQNQLKHTITEFSTGMPITVHDMDNGEFIIERQTPWKSEEWLNSQEFLQLPEPTIEAYTSDTKSVSDLSKDDIENTFYVGITEAMFDRNLRQKRQPEYYVKRGDPRVRVPLPKPYQNGAREIAMYIEEKWRENLNEIIENFGSEPIFRIESGYGKSDDMIFKLDLNDKIDIQE